MLLALERVTGMNGLVEEFERRLKRHRGPVYGRGPGRPWRGIVEDRPALWVTWVVAVSRRLGKGAPVSVTIDGVDVPIVKVPLTFGPRHYFVCPWCHRRCEALFFLGREFGCRKCL